MIGRNALSRCCVLFFITLSVAVDPVRAQTAGTQTDAPIPTLAPLLEKVMPAVVNIAVTSRSSAENNPLYSDPFFRHFFNLPEAPPPRSQLSAGSGVIVDAAKGYVLTNHHVVEHGAEIVVTLKDKRQFKAKLVGSDPGTDIALLKIDADSLTALEPGDSSTLKVGDYVVAIGNPFGLGQTVTSGIVSALGRSGISPQGYEDFIQTDASINPGNSGGALLTLDGRLVGINTAILSSGGGNIGIGFAVPSNMAKAVMAQLIEFGEVRRGRLGVIVQDMTPDLATAMGVDRASGAVVTKVEPGSPAEKAGIKAGDVIIEIDGQAVMDSRSLRNRIGLKRVGAKVEIVFLRDGARKSARAELGTVQTASNGGEAGTGRLAGAVLRDQRPGDPLHGRIKGVLVENVEAGSPAARVGLLPGDVILAVNRTPVRSVAELRQLLARQEGTIALHIQRGSARLFIVVR